MKRVWIIFACGTGLTLAACAPARLAQPSATADSVMWAQYAARGSHGAMSGDEAGKVMHGYVEQIGKPALQSSTSSVRNQAMGGRAYDH
jgi:hypothetical protein